MKTFLILLLAAGSTLAQITPAPTPPVITNDCVVIATEVYGRVGNASWREIELFRYLDATFTGKDAQVISRGHAVAVWIPFPGAAVYGFINSNVGTVELGQLGPSSARVIAMAIQQKVTPTSGHAFFITDAHFADLPGVAWQRPQAETDAWTKLVKQLQQKAKTQ